MTDQASIEKKIDSLKGDMVDLNAKLDKRVDTVLGRFMEWEYSGAALVLWGIYTVAVTVLHF